MWRSSAVALLFAVVPSLSTRAAEPREPQPRRASFHVSNAFVLKLPQDAKVVRIWLAVPQEDAQSTIRELHGS
jgi:hypothetical protein